MVYSLNKVELIGYVGIVQEGTSQNGDLWFRFSISTDRSIFKKENQEIIKDWHYVMVFRDKAEQCRKYLKPGDMVSVCGEIRYNKDRKDPKKIWTEIHIPDYERIGFLGRRDISKEITSVSNLEENTKTSELPMIDGVKPYASSANKPINPFKTTDIEDLPF